MVTRDSPGNSLTGDQWRVTRDSPGNSLTGDQWRVTRDSLGNSLTGVSGWLPGTRHVTV